MGPASWAPSVSTSALSSHVSGAGRSFAELGVVYKNGSRNGSCLAVDRKAIRPGNCRWATSSHSGRRKEFFRRGSSALAVCALRQGNERMQQAPISESKETGFFNGVSSKAAVGIIVGILANIGVGSALAAADAATTSSDDASNFKFVVICVAEAIALTGAAVGGILARQRKVELEKINAQLRQINLNLRRQSRVESYAPNLTYAPVGSGRMPDSQVRRDPVRDEILQHLKAGKRLLREKNNVGAFGEFREALGLAQQIKDTAEEKKAVRGLGASCQRQGKYKDSINYHSKVLKISKLTGENSGDTEAYGAIADCYTDLGDLETAGKYYDRYIARLESDDTI